MDVDFSPFARFKLPPLECGPGWRPLILETLSRIAAIVGDASGLEIVQIKQKYARLVIYVETWGDAARFESEVEEVIADAEERSGAICDQCSKPGKEFATNLDYLVTRCDQHAPNHGSKAP